MEGKSRIFLKQAVAFQTKRLLEARAWCQFILVLVLIFNLGYTTDYNNENILGEILQWCLLAFLWFLVIASYREGNLWLIKLVLLCITVEFTIPFYMRKPSLPSWLYECEECESDGQDAGE
mmetsp:Transcript_41679/g.63688  ORF Transcript_41679/g.63688 Transcript_41679/m.63688 type:complete len:121 (+) Transcript_41679:443-805(+)